MSAGVQKAPFTILIAALGGEGGGVLMNWIVDCAIAEGLPVQSTSVPGVAQRTGSTSYYIEIGQKDTTPVFALVPMPGRVDLVIASELSEAGRIIERGFVSPKRTTLITSTSRVLTTAEKMQMGDGRFPSERVLVAGEALAQRFIAFDLEAIARDCGTIVSAPMFGALAGTGLLPWRREACEAVMGKGRGAAASLAGFAQAYAMAAQGGSVETLEPAAAPDVTALGLERCADYMDADYATLFQQRVARLKAASGADDPLRAHALEEATRRLALWMTYEDIPRVADLKIRPERFDRIRSEAQMTAGQVLQVTDLLKPGLEEVAAMLPAALGRGLLAYGARGGKVPFLGRGIHLHTTSLMGMTAFRILAWMGRFRRQSLRFQQENEAISLWLDMMVQALPLAPSFAGALAELPRLLKGYGETQARGLANYEAIIARLVQPVLNRGVRDEDAPALRKAISAALEDPEGLALSKALPLPLPHERSAA